MKVYKQIANKVTAIRSLQETQPDSEWIIRHKESIDALIDNHLPHGSGIDSGVRFNLINSHGDKLVFTFDYHHMRDGYYTHWSSHVLTVTPSLVCGIEMKITKGGERDYYFMDYLYQSFEYSLNADVELI